MNLSDLNKLARTTDDDEDEDCCVVEAKLVDDKDTPPDDPDEPQSLEEDLTDALDLLEQALLMMENMKVHRKRIVSIPTGMRDLMEEIADLLDQYEIQR